MRTSRIQVGQKVRELASHRRDKLAGYFYLKQIFRHLREILDI